VQRNAVVVPQLREAVGLRLRSNLNELFDESLGIGGHQSTPSLI